MKKEYMTPEMEVVKIETQQIIAASIDINTTPIDPSIAAGREFDFDDLDDIDSVLGW